MMKGLVCYLLVLVLPVPAYSWNIEGHLIIATLSQQYLAPKTSKKIDKYLKILSNESKKPSFKQLSIWADLIRFKGNHLFDQWHYIHIPYKKDRPQKLLKTYRKDNVLVKSIQLMDVLTKRNISVEEHAWSLRMLIHLVGDLHQPMHTINFYSKIIPLQHGDLNGLRYKISHRKYHNLHSYWDACAGLLSFKGGQKNKQRRALIKSLLEQDHEPLVRTLESQSYKSKLKQWTYSSYTIAHSQAYTIPFGAKPPHNYEEMTKKACRQQLISAAKNLALLLNHLYMNDNYAQAE